MKSEVSWASYASPQYTSKTHITINDFLNVCLLPKIISMYQ